MCVAGNDGPPGLSGLDGTDGKDGVPGRPGPAGELSLIAENNLFLFEEIVLLSAQVPRALQERTAKTDNRAAVAFPDFQVETFVFFSGGSFQESRRMELDFA